MILDFTEEEFHCFSQTEQKIILLIRKYEWTEEEVRAKINFPLGEMHRDTFRGHISRMKKKISMIRKRRAESHKMIEDAGK